MRTFEILTLLFATLSLLPFIVRRPRLRTISLGALLAMLLHLFLEGYRWQMLPAYLLVIILVLLTLRTLSARSPALPRTMRLFAVPLGIIWLVGAAALPALLPVPQPLPPTGPYGVGSRIYHLVDQERPEPYSDVVDHRELMVQIWYPGEIDADSVRAPFIDRIDVAGPAIANRLNLPSFLLNHLNLVRTHAYLEAPIVPDGPYPLLIFSHGLAGIRAQNTSLMQHLASHGYVVAAIDHPYANVITVYPDDRIAFYNKDAVMPSSEDLVTSGTRLVAVWEQDIAFVFRHIEQWSQQNGHPLYAQVATERVGLLGHSTGAGAAVQTCASLDHCQAALALDGWIQVVSEAVRNDPYAPALMLLSAPDWLGTQNREEGMRLYSRRQNEGYALTVAGAVHFDFTDIPLMSPVTPLLNLSGDIDGPRMVRIIDDYTLAFFDHTLKEQPAPLLQGPTGAYPEVTFAP
jgi:predicted dienelactone hydrolase